VVLEEDAVTEMAEEAVPLGIPQDVDMPPGLSPGARVLFRAIKALNRHRDPDRMMDDVHKGNMHDG
jgi:hypothetical protein